MRKRERSISRVGVIINRGSTYPNMTNHEWIEMFQMIPPEQHNQLVITLQDGTDLVVETLFKFEPHFLVMRGRQGGSIDESRAFFIPYSRMLYTRIERVVKMKELYALFNEDVPEHLQREGATLGEESSDASTTSPDSKLKPRPAVGSEGTGVKTNLLERIRAARSASVNSTRQQSKGS